jgi:4-amino-4-deoxy-L-arabinose transferase-like glycosyltransferase
LSGSNELVTKQPVFKLFLYGFISVALLKLFFAAVLDLYSDEAFYWQASAYPAIAYSDLPFMTSFLVGIGSTLDDGNPFAARLLFILLGSTLPFLIYWLSLPITNKQQALESAAICLCLPLAGFLGLLAVPDVPLLFFGVLSIGFFERALRTNNSKYWIATGFFVALGLCTHYRFFLYPAAALIFLITYPAARVQWKNPMLWITMAIACLGLIPILWFNLSNELSSASFYFVDRHPWEFQASGLLHVFKQAGLSSPPLYCLFIFTLYLLYKEARSGNSSAALLLSFSLTNLLVYMLLAPWTDATSTSIHWPLSAYMPLLVFAPVALRKTYHWVAVHWNEAIAYRVTASIPVIGFLGTLIAFLGIGSQAFQLPLQAVVGPGVLSNKMAGWKFFAAHTAEILESDFSSATPIVVTDNYYTAAQLEFAGISTETYTLDRDKAVRDGRITQYELWGRDEKGLAEISGRPVLYINEDSTLTIPDKHDLLGVMCHYIENLSHLGELSLFNRDKVFSFYKADNLVSANSNESYRASPCPFPAQAWIDYPEADDTLSGIVNISGWAFNEDIGIDKVDLVINDSTVASAQYGISREDVVTAMSVATDPNAPALGFSITLDSSQLQNGSVELAIDLTNKQGIKTRYGERSVVIEN